MKGLLLAILIVIGLDEAIDRGAGVATCYRLVTDLAHGTERDVGNSVYRQ